MKTSSTEPGPASQDGVRLATFDRPLGNGSSGAGSGDPALERRIDAAVHRGRTQGRAQGFASGWAQGRRAAAEHEQAEILARAEQDAARRRADGERVDAALDQLLSAARRLDRAMAPAWAELADVIADGALSIARAALGRELAAVDEPLVDTVRTALRALAEPRDVVLRLNPADLASLGTLLATATVPPGLQLVADPDVEPGDVLAMTPVQRLKLSMPSAVAAAEEVLRS